MKKTALTAAMTAALIMPGAQAFAADTPPNSNPTAFWRDKTTSLSNIDFTLDRGDFKDVSWATAFSDDPDYVHIVATTTHTKPDKAPKVSDFAGKDKSPDTPTVAKTPDGKLVVVVPTHDVSVHNGHLRAGSIDAKVEVNVSDDADNPIVVPTTPPTKSLHALYEGTDDAGKKATSKGDVDKALRPTVGVGNATVGYDSEKKNKQDPPPSDGGVIPLNPKSTNRLNVSRYVKTDDPDSVKSVTTAYQPTDDAELDAKDGHKDGLTPINGQSRVEEQAAGDGEVTTPITVDIPDGVDTVYLHNEVVNQDGEEVAPPSMMTAAVTDVELDAQASTENQNSQLKPDTTQKIWDQVDVTNLMPGKPYNVVTQLFQCGDGNCVEVAAVNREIIPRASETMQNFAVEVDTSDMGDDDTFEWATTVYEGTGDFNEMGNKLAEIADHPDSQVLSFTGTRSSHQAGERVEEQAAETFDSHPLSDDDRMTGSADVEDARGNTGKKYEIVDEAPPANMNVVRENNQKLDDVSTDQVNRDRAKYREDHKTPWLPLGVLTGIVLTSAVAMAFASRAKKDR